MSELSDLVHYAYSHLFDIGLDALASWSVTGMEDKIPTRIIDDATANRLEIPVLFYAMNNTQTITGGATLLRSLLQPLDSIELIHEKQNSIQELKKCRELARELKDYIGSVVEKERSLYRYFSNNYDEYTQYNRYRDTKVFFERLVDKIKNVPKPGTPYLETLMDDIRSLDESRVYDLIKGPVFSTRGGLKSGSEVGFLTPRVKYTLRSRKPTLIALLLSLPALSAVTCDPLVAVESGFYMAMMGFVFLESYPRKFDYNHFTHPLRDIYVVDNDIRTSIDALGKIDELLSLYEYSKNMSSKAIDMTTPVVTDDSPHYFVAKEAKNPILSATDSYCVPNDINLNGQKMTFISGPNSGGKTIHCKTIGQLQVQGQIGSDVPAKEAEMSIADHIFYQQSKHGESRDREGSFGTELIETRDHFFISTPKSLVILDAVLSGATEYEEGLNEVYKVMDGFYKTGCNTILTTPLHGLIEKFKQEGRGQYLKFELKGRMPTYKLVPGISRKMHADLVGERIGFSPKDIKKHLKDKGYISSA